MGISQKAPGRTAFTLIELLVVISIISLLVSILLPALGKAREASKTVTCLTRQKSFGVYSQLYQQDHNSWYAPNRAYGGAFPSALIWVNLMQPYVGASLGTLNASHTPDQNYFLCPGQDYRRPDPFGAAAVRTMAYISDGWRVTNYMQNGWFGYGNMSSQVERWHMKRFVHDHSRLLEMGEIKGVSSPIGYYANTSVMIKVHPTNATNILFVDGHAATVKDPADTLGDLYVFETDYQ